MMPPEMPSHTDRTIDRILSTINNDKPLAEHDLINVYTVASVDFRLAEYRQTAKEMSLTERRDEAHNSAKLAENMSKIGDPRPHKDCHAHAIIAGKHPFAQQARLVFAAYGRRKDDAINGVWLPRNTAAKKLMPMRLKNAMPHSRVHRTKYFVWVDRQVNLQQIKSVEQLDRKLSHIAFRLQTGTFPDWVMLSAREEIPDAV